MIIDFSIEVKNEILSVCKYKKHSTLLGVLSCSEEFSSDNIIIKSNEKDILHFCIDCIYECLKIRLDDKVEQDKNGYYCVMSKDYDAKKIKQYVENKKYTIKNNKNMIKDFIRGCFLMVGNIKNPDNKYYLEFVFKDSLAVKELKDVIKNQGFEFKEKVRQKKEILYMNNSSDIEDFLTYLGATKSCLKIMNLKVYKDLRNKVNRIVNCETYNISKVITATTEQLKCINKIKEIKGLDYLDEDLREIAEKRLKHPDKSLIELCKLLSFEITKSGLYYKLKKIESIAKKVSNGQTPPRNFN